jgi:hypothetical protein
VCVLAVGLIIVQKRKSKRQREMFPETIPTSASNVLTTFANDANNTNAPILRARFNENGEYAILCKDRSLFLINPRTNLCLKEYSGAHAREVRDGCASRDNSKLVSCGGDRGISGGVVFWWFVRVVFVVFACLTTRFLPRFFLFSPRDDCVFNAYPSALFLLDAPAQAYSCGT